MTEHDVTMTKQILLQFRRQAYIYISRFGRFSRSKDLDLDPNVFFLGDFYITFSTHFFRKAELYRKTQNATNGKKRALNKIKKRSPYLPNLCTLDDQRFWRTSTQGPLGLIRLEFSLHTPGPTFSHAGLGRGVVIWKTAFSRDFLP